MSITIKDNTDEFLFVFEKAIENGLTAIGMTAEGHAKREITKLVYSRGNNEKKYRLTGRLRNSITFAVSGEKAHISERLSKSCLSYDEFMRDLLDVINSLRRRLEIKLKIKLDDIDEQVLRRN